MNPDLKNLIQDLEKDDWFTRQRAAKTLGKMGEDAKEALPQLIIALKDDEAPVRTAAKMALKKIATPEEIEAAKKSSALKADDSSTQVAQETENKEAKEFVNSLDENVSEKTKKFAAGLFDPDWKERLTAVQMLAQVGSEALPCLIKALEDENEYIRREAATGLGKVPPREAGASIAPLIEQLADNVSGVRKTVAWSLGELAVAASESIPHLIDNLNDTDKEVRAACAWSLGIFGEVAREKLREALNREETRVVAGAADALGNMGYHASSVIPDMKSKLKHPDRDVRFSLVVALGKIGPAARTCTDDLIELLKDEDAEVRWRSSETLRKIGTPEAKEAWKNFSEQAKDAVPGLIRKLNNRDDEWVRKSAADTLGKMQAEAAITFLIRALNDEYSVVRSAASKALQKIGTKEALQAVEDYGGNDDSEELSDLINALKHENQDVRLDAARALWGSTEDAAVEALIEVMNNDAYEHIRESARLALKKADTEKAREALKK